MVSEDPHRNSTDLRTLQKNKILASVAQPNFADICNVCRFYLSNTVGDTKNYSCLTSYELLFVFLKNDLMVSERRILYILSSNKKLFTIIHQHYPSLYSNFSIPLNKKQFYMQTTLASSVC